MPVIIKNLTNRPVLLRLNSGSTLHIAPRQISGECADGDIQNNPMVEKLQQRLVISLEPIKAPKKKTESAEEKAESPRKKKASAKANQ